MVRRQVRGKHTQRLGVVPAGNLGVGRAKARLPERSQALGLDPGPQPVGVGVGWLRGGELVERTKRGLPLVGLAQPPRDRIAVVQAQVAAGFVEPADRSGIGGVALKQPRQQIRRRHPVPRVVGKQRLLAKLAHLGGDKRRGRSGRTGGCRAGGVEVLMQRPSHRPEERAIALINRALGVVAAAGGDVTRRYDGGLQRSNRQIKGGTQRRVGCRIAPGAQDNEMGGGVVVHREISAGADRMAVRSGVPIRWSDYSIDRQNRSSACGKVFVGLHPSPITEARNH